MAIEAIRTLVIPCTGLALCAAAIVAFCRVAPAMGLVDVPGGRKVHACPVPLVGGLSIFAALLVSAYGFGLAPGGSYFLVALSIVIAIGLWDDLTEISPRLKFGIQIVSSAIMIWGAGVELHSVGDLLGLRPIGLWIFGVPLTIFAIVGVVNSVNMMDGLDGLAGSISLVAFAWYAAVARQSGLELQFETALVFCGTISGFLLFNLRLPWQPQAKVFLGDAGSLMLGFALGWFAIDLTQGEGRSFPPIAALWVLLLPLADCVSLMARRLSRRRSPFMADRHHIHHYLLAHGFTHGQTLAILVGLSAAFGAVGFAGWRLGLPEPLLFWSFFFGFFAYHFWARKAWESLERKAAIDTAAFAPLVEDEEEPVSAA